MNAGFQDIVKEDSLFKWQGRFFSQGVQFFGRLMGGPTVFGEFGVWGPTFLAKFRGTNLFWVFGRGAHLKRACQIVK